MNAIVAAGAAIEGEIRKARPGGLDAFIEIVSSFNMVLQHALKKRRARRFRVACNWLRAGAKVFQRFGNCVIPLLLGE
jgi:hypothetical protein